MKDDFEHPIMLYSGSRNRNDTNADGIFDRYTGPRYLDLK
jgi:hypothetical protein